MPTLTTNEIPQARRTQTLVESCPGGLWTIANFGEAYGLSIENRRLKLTTPSTSCMLEQDHILWRSRRLDVHTNTIPRSVEWILLDTLHRHIDRIATVDWKTVGDSLQLKNHCRAIEFELRSFLTENLQNLADLDFEDDDDSAGAVQNAMHQLPDVCDLLESRLNTTLSLVEPKGTTYPNLTAIVEHLDSPTGLIKPFALLSSSLPYWRWTYWITRRDAEREILFLFKGMTEDEFFATVEMLKNLNKLIEGLKRSTASLERLSDARVPFSGRPFSEGPSTYSFFIRQAKATFRTMLSSHLQCSHREEGAHKVLLQLPSLEDISSKAVYGSAPEMEAFVSVCTDDVSSSAASRTIPEMEAFSSVSVERKVRKWQEASFRLINGNEDTTYRKLKLCPAIKRTEEDDIRLEVHVLHHVNISDYEGCDVQVPITYNDRRLGCNPGRLLSEFIEAGLGGSPESGHNSSRTPIDRRSLAGRLALGMLLSLQFDHIQGWDPKQMFIHYISKEVYHVSCKAMQRDSRSKLQPPELDHSNPDVAAPFPALTSLARTLLEICYGQLPRNELTGSADAHGSEWMALKKEIADRTKNEEGSLQNFAFLAAARECLFFHYSYADEYHKSSKPDNRSYKPVNPVDVAKYTFYNKIMREFEDGKHTDSQPSQHIIEKPRLNSKGQEEPVTAVQPHNGHSNGDLNPHGCSKSTELPMNIKKPSSSNGQRKSSSKGISLFDDAEQQDENPKEAGRAKKFFEDCKTFRETHEPRLVIPNRQRVRVAIIDTGVDLFHPTLKDCVSKYYNWIEESLDANDLDGHGTYCAYFLSQVAPEAEVHVAKVFSGKDFSETEARNISKAIRHAVDDWRVDIISMSFGLPQPSQKIEHDIKEAIKHAAFNNVLMFAAASNEGLGHPRTFPSTIRPVICIHASDGTGNNGGINPICEQGDHNFMTLGIAMKSPKFRQDGYAYKSGTSFATPVAAGIAANLLQIAPNEESKNKLRDPEDMRKMFALMSEQVDKYAYVAPSLLRRQKDNLHFLEERGLS